MPRKPKRLCFRRKKNRTSKYSTKKEGGNVGPTDCPPSVEPCQSFQQSVFGDHDYISTSAGAFSNVSVKDEVKVEDDSVSDENIPQFSVFSMEIAMDVEEDSLPTLPADVFDSTPEFYIRGEGDSKLPMTIVQVPQESIKSGKRGYTLPADVVHVSLKSNKPDEGGSTQPADIVQHPLELLKSSEADSTQPTNIVQHPLELLKSDEADSTQPADVIQSICNLPMSGEGDFALAPPDVIRSTEDLLRSVLPTYWTVLADQRGYNCLQVSRGRDPAFQRNVYVTHCGTLRITVHRKELPEDLVKEITKDWPSGLRLTSQSSAFFVDNVLRVVTALRSYEVCAGVKSPKYESMWATDKSGYIDNNPYGEARYTKTFRTSNCTFLIPVVKWSCSECMRAKHRFAGRYKLHTEETASPYTGNLYLTDAQKDLKLANQSRIIRNLKKKLTFTLGKAEAIKELDESSS